MGRRKPIRPARAEAVAWLEAMRPPGRVLVERPDGTAQETVFICIDRETAQRRKRIVQETYGNGRVVESNGRWYVTRIVKSPGIRD